MPELGELLRRAAGDPPDLPDFDAIRRRAKPRIVRRRVAGGATALVVGLTAWAGTVSIAAHLGDEPVPVVDQVHGPPEASARDLRKGQLEPGKYAGSVGAYDVVLSTQNDAWTAVVSHPSWLALAYRQYLLHLQVWESVVPPSAENATARQDPPDDVVAWLTAHPRLSSSAPIEVEIAGMTATQFDVRVVEPLQATPRECTTRCVILGRVAGDGELVDLEVGQHARFVVFGSPGRQLIALYRAPEDEFAVLDEAVQALLADLRLDTSD